MSRDSEDAMQDAHVTTFGVITHNRPEALKRCLAGFLKNFEEHGRQPHIAVMDDSDQPEQLSANAACVAEFRASHRALEFHYAGVAEKRRYMEALMRHTDVDPDIISFALADPERLGRTIGANRNALFLQAAGECFMGVDDDVICRPAISHETQERIVVTDMHDPTRVRLFADRDTLLNERPSGSVDLLGIHEEILGRSLGSLLRMQPERPVIVRQRGHDASQSTKKIRISWTGFYGDSGARYPTYYLWRDKHLRAQLTVSEEEYLRLSVSREIFRAPECLTFGSGAYCQSTAVAYDNRNVLPPFMPVLRGEDVIFGRVFSSCFEGSLIGYSPWALLHSPIENRNNSASDIVLSAKPMPFATILAILIKAFGDAEPEQNAETSLQKLGEHLCALGRSSVSDFSNLLQPHLVKATMQRIDYLTGQIPGDLPNHSRKWSDDIRGHIAVLHKKLGSTGLLQSLLLEESSAAAGERLALVQWLAFRYGQLLKVWPSLMAGAWELKVRGVTISER